ncbi:MAG: rod shape-determining protein [Clostridia bacterium]
MANIELAIDFGTSYITIFQRGRGIILKEASVAIVNYHKRKKVLVAVGNSALRDVKATSGTAQVVYPIRDGAVVNIEDASFLMTDLIKKIMPDGLIKPYIKAIVLISCGLTVVERKDIETVVLNAGVNDAILVESPLALLAYTNSVGGLFLDIGGGTAEIASVTRLGISYGCAVNIGGNLLNNKIVDYFFEHYGLKIGEYAAEKLKIDIGSMFDNDLSATEASGRDVLEGTPRSLEASAKDIRNALAKPIDTIIEVVESVLNVTPPELAGSIAKKGIFISGGTSELPGLIEYISIRLGLAVTQLQDFDNAVAFGGGVLLNDRKLLSEMLNLKID